MQFFLGFLAGGIFSLFVLPRILLWMSHMLYRWLDKHGKL